MKQKNADNEEITTFRAAASSSKREARRQEKASRAASRAANTPLSGSRTPQAPIGLWYQASSTTLFSSSLTSQPQDLQGCETPTGGSLGEPAPEAMETSEQSGSGSAPNQ